MFHRRPAWRAGRTATPPSRLDPPPEWPWRRAALVSTVPLNSRARRHWRHAATLAILPPAPAGSSDLVVKALSWALRGTREARPFRRHSFLADHREHLAPRVLAK